MKSFLCAFNFSRRLVGQSLKFVKPSERPAPIVNPNQQNEKKPVGEAEQLELEFKNTKTLQMIDRLINAQMRKGYSMDQILREVQKGGLITQEIRDAFQTDSQKSATIQDKLKVVQEQYDKACQNYPEEMRLHFGQENSTGNTNEELQKDNTKVNAKKQDLAGEKKANKSQYYQQQQQQQSQLSKQQAIQPTQTKANSKEQQKPSKKSDSKSQNNSQPAPNNKSKSKPTLEISQNKPVKAKKEEGQKQPLENNTYVKQKDQPSKPRGVRR